MAGWMFKSLCCLLLAVILVLDVVETRRYGGYRTRTRVRVRNSVRQRVRVRNRMSYMRHGSSPFTGSTWQVAFLAGSIYGGSRYMRGPRYYRNRDAMPFICTNYYDSDRNGTVYGYFVCPRDGEPPDRDRCCGSSRREYCCRYFDDTGRTVGIVVGVLLLVTVIGVIVYCCCKRKGKEGHIFSKFPGRSSNRKNREQAVPLNEPAPVMMMTKPAQQPAPPAPAYVAPPEQQPMPQGPYPPPGAYGPPTEGYPPPGYTSGYDPNAPMPYQQPGEKPHLPSGEINTGGYPYPSEPGAMMGPPPPGPMPYPADPTSMPQAPAGYGYGQPNAAPYPPQPYPSNPAPPYPQ